MSFNRRLIQRQQANIAMKHRAWEHQVNADLRAQRRYARREYILWGAIMFLILAFGFAALWLAWLGK